MHVKSKYLTTSIIPGVNVRVGSRANRGRWKRVLFLNLPLFGALYDSSKSPAPAEKTEQAVAPQKSSGRVRLEDISETSVRINIRVRV